MSKFKIAIASFLGAYTKAVKKIIDSHNNGKVEIDIDVIVGYLLAKKAQDGKNIFIKSEGDNNQVIHVSQNGGHTFYMTIEEVEEELCTEEYIATHGEAIIYD